MAAIAAAVARFRKALEESYQKDNSSYYDTPYPKHKSICKQKQTNGKKRTFSQA